MKHLKTILVTLIILLAPLTMPFIFSSQTASAAGANGCGQVQDFFGLVPWYAYLQNHFYSVDGVCGFHIAFTNEDSNQNTTGISGDNLKVIWLIGLAVFEDLLRIAGMVAVAMGIYGGFRYMTSQGNAEETKKAQETVINALIGLGIAVIAAATISFLAGLFK